MSRTVVTFGNFKGGEFGLLGGMHAPGGSFTGKNVVPLLDGSLAPRSGLVDLGVTGTTTGPVLGFGYNASQSRAWYIQGNTVRDFDTSAPAPAVRSMATTLGSTPTDRVRAVNAENDFATFLSNYGDKEYLLDHVAGTLTAIAAGPGGKAIGVYNDRLVIAGPPAYPTRLYYSAPGDFSSWPAANYVDIGYGYAIIAVMAHRDRVTIAKTDGTWWILTGVPGVNDVLRRALRSMRPGSSTNGPTRWGITSDGLIWFLPELGEYPTSFNGSTLSVLEHLSFKQDADEPYSDESTLPKVGVSGLLKPSDMFMCTGQSDTSADDNQGLLFTRAAWTHHVFDKNISGYIDGRFDLHRRVLICDGGSASAAPKFYVWSYNLNRPPNSGHTWESLGDASSTPPPAEFTLPDWFATTNAAMRHRGLWDRLDVKVVATVIDFKKWNHGYGGNNSFTVTVTPIRRDVPSQAPGGDGTAQSKTWTEAATVASSSGTDDRIELTFDPQFSNGFRLKFSGLVGVAIKDVQVEVEIKTVAAGV